MVEVIFKYNGEEDRKVLHTKYEAYCKVLDAYNMCEDHFVGAKFADSEKWINILDAEEYVSQVYPVKEALEQCAIHSLDESDVLDYANREYFLSLTEFFPSWKDYVKEYAAEIERQMDADCIFIP